MDGGDGTVRLGALNLKPDHSGFDSSPDVSVSSPVTRQKAAAAKQFIENHYKNHLQGLQDRKERYAVWNWYSFFFVDFFSAWISDILLLLRLKSKVVKFNAFIVAFIYEYFRLKVEEYLVHNSYNYLKAMLTRLINCQVNVRIILFFLFEDV